MSVGPLAVALLDPLLDDPVLRDHHLLHGARAQLLRRAGHEPERRKHSSVPPTARARTSNATSTRFSCSPRELSLSGQVVT